MKGFFFEGGGTKQNLQSYLMHCVLTLPIVFSLNSFVVVCADIFAIPVSSAMYIWNSNGENFNLALNSSSSLHWVNGNLNWFIFCPIMTLLIMTYLFIHDNVNSFSVWNYIIFYLHSHCLHRYPAWILMFQLFRVCCGNIKRTVMCIHSWFVEPTFWHFLSKTFVFPAWATVFRTWNLCQGCLDIKGQGLRDFFLFKWQVLVPRSCYRAVLNSDQYLDLSYCNILGVEPQVAVPQPSPDVLRLDVLQPDDHAEQSDVKKYMYKITWADKLPRKCMYMKNSAISCVSVCACKLMVTRWEQMATQGLIMFKAVSFALGNNICEVQNLVLVYYSVSSVKQVMACHWIVKQSKNRWTAFKIKIIVICHLVYQMFTASSRPCASDI